MAPNPPSTRQLRELARRDPALGAAMKRTPQFPGFPRGIQRGSNFHSLARSVIYQQLSGHAAGTIYGRVRALTVSGKFPTPAEVLDFSEDRLRSAGLSRAKVRCLRDLSERVETGTLKMRGLGRLPDDEIIERLTDVWGIGEWSAQMFLIFKLGRLDIMATGDLGIQEGMRRLDGLIDRPSPAELGERAQAWEPLRSVASWTLWRLCDVAYPAATAK
jgi:DNA-3-methyladenine glycosylase II